MRLSFCTPFPAEILPLFSPNVALLFGYPVSQYLHSHVQLRRFDDSFKTIETIIIFKKFLPYSNNY